jgi:membrane-bound lytic murein transglycosylase D
MGLWQFLYNAASMFDFKLPVLKTNGAIPKNRPMLLVNIYNISIATLTIGTLALAAYNVGIGEVKKAIEKSGGKTNFWELAPHLPAQARGYVPAFIAANFVMQALPLQYSSC